MSKIRAAFCVASSWGLLSGLVGNVGCSSDNSSTAPAKASPDASADASDQGVTSADAATITDSAASTADQTPPMGATVLEAWLATGAYKAWKSEPAVHGQRLPSPHGFDRIYSNATIVAHASDTAPWPAGAAAVKELYASATATTPVGYAVYLKTQDDSAGGANWYWYERVPLDSPAPHDSAGVVADGLGQGDSGANNICVGCHVAAGKDKDHTPSPNGHDQVYTPLQP